MLARIVHLFGHRVRIITIDSELKPLFEKLGPDFSQKRLERIMQIPSYFGHVAPSDVIRCSWESYQAEYANQGRVLSPPHTFVRRRRRYHVWNFDLICSLYRRLSEKMQQDFFLTAEHIPDTADLRYQTLQSTRLIAFGVRFSRNWQPERNISEEQFIEMARYFRRTYPKHSLMIICDDDEVEVVKGWSNAGKIECLFSKDYSGSFIDDMRIALMAEFFFQYMGGGIMGPIFSRIPYFYFARPATETMTGPLKLATWSTETQCFCNQFAELEIEKVDLFLKEQGLLADK